MPETNISVEIHKILAKYWGYSQFREKQEEIILSVLQGNDTLALLPTGGGKSICFQVPAMALEGICIVVSPLISLMKDQVEQLHKKQISAIAIYAGMSRFEVDRLLDNCVNGRAKFLYISPERLQTEIFLERLKKMKVSLLAIDEAHCISQWGYDFRPAYLRIAEIREVLPQIPCVALTATATEIVKREIQEKLIFKESKKVFQKSFARANLSYSAFEEENKLEKLLDILRKVQGAAVVYANSRKLVKEIAVFLQKNKVSADFYHAGLSNAERSKKQDAWIHNKLRVIVATNAFGMGIDKPDVRLVVHLELPATLEAYYQEAGRAGRDTQKAYAVALYHAQDSQNLEIQILKSYPTEQAIRRVYQSLANFYQIAVGSSMGASYDFDFATFIQTFNLEAMEVHFAMKILADEGFIQLSEAYFSPSKITFVLNNKELYDFQLKNKSLDVFIQIILRTYGAEVFTHFVRISEAQIAKNAQITTEQAIKMLDSLQQNRVLIYEKQKEKPQLTFLTARQSAENLALDTKKIEVRKERDLRKAKAVSHYMKHQNRCRTQLLLEYFGEISYEPCGVCDVCLKKKKDNRLSENHYEQYRERILNALDYKNMTIEELEKQLQVRNREAYLEALHKIIEIGELEYDDYGKLRKL